mmetsp:Transcript_49449/g.110899  ORF Transcript_49449/g.110899 Transcript_49449/m.110899 type:complete len:690 (-) Transcript_49449:170-2239(-)
MSVGYGSQFPTSVSGALAFAQQLHTHEVHQLKVRMDELQREVERLKGPPMTNGHSFGHAAISPLPSPAPSTPLALENRKDISANLALRESPSADFDKGSSMAHCAEKSVASYTSGKAGARARFAAKDLASSSGMTLTPVSSATTATKSNKMVKVNNTKFLHGASMFLSMDHAHSDPLDGSAEWSEEHMRKPWWHRFVMSGRFDMLSGTVIIINAVAIGYEAALRSKDRGMPDWLPYVEQAFLSIYIVEFVLRMRVGGLSILCTGWINLDLLLLICGIADVGVRMVVGTSGPGSEFLENLMVIRVLRLARVARVFRLVNAFKTLWVLVNGLYHSMLTLLWTFVLIFIIMYCFAIFAVEVIKEDDDQDDEYNETVRKHFSDLFVTCLTLLQGVTLDSVGGIYKPVIKAYPALVIYFCAFIFIVSIALMNLVTAIMVESALDQSHQDKARNRERQMEKRKRQVGQLKVMFHELDADGSGMLSDEELVSAPEEVKDKLLDITETDDLEELFRLLDYDNDGEVSIDEFCEGVEKFSQGKLELFNITRLTRDVLRSTGDIFDALTTAPDVRDRYRQPPSPDKEQPTGKGPPALSPRYYEGVMSPRGSRAAPRRQGSAGSRLGESSPRNNGQQVPTMATAASATHADNGHGLLTPAVLMVERAAAEAVPTDYPPPETPQQTGSSHLRPGRTVVSSV